MPRTRPRCVCLRLARSPAKIRRKEKRDARPSTVKDLGLMRGKVPVRATAGHALGTILSTTLGSTSRPPKTQIPTYDQAPRGSHGHRFTVVSSSSTSALCLFRQGSGRTVVVAQGPSLHFVGRHSRHGRVVALDGGVAQASLVR